MEYIIFLCVVLLIFLFVLIQGMMMKKKMKQKRMKELESEQANKPKRLYPDGRMDNILLFHKTYQDRDSIDAITWNDLDMNRVFERINYTHSACGEEMLYHMLHQQVHEEAYYETLEKQLAFYQQESKKRTQLKFCFDQIYYMGKYSLLNYLSYLKDFPRRSNVINYIMDAGIVISLIVALFVSPFGYLACIGLIICNILTYFSKQKEIEPYITSFAYIIRLIMHSKMVADQCDLVFAEEKEKLNHLYKELKILMREGRLLTSYGRIGTGGNPLDVLMDYLRMGFHVDLICFNRMLGKVIVKEKDILELYISLGYIDAVLAISTYRDSINRYCIPKIDKDAECSIEGMVHPLMDQAVANSVKGMECQLITGSNASGKSTYLKTYALSVLMAQTIHTACADHYEAPFCLAYSSMSLKDSLENNESYYMAEIKSLKRIMDRALDAESDADRKVICFVDEVLRGTNTVERIAASTQILLELHQRGVICIAATHDIELTRLLANYYVNYHFEEKMLDGDISFSYEKQAGPAVTQNAVLLLKSMGYSEHIVDMATRRAKRFMEQNIWEL